MARAHDSKKAYYEVRALLTLQKLFPEKHLGLIRKDKPDLVDEHKNIGVEVVRAVDAKQEEFSSFFTKHVQNKKVCDVDEQKLQKFLDAGNWLIMNDMIFDRPADEIIGYSTSTAHKNLPLLKNAIQRKIKYIDKTAWLTESLNLYLFSNIFRKYGINEIEELVKHAQQLQNSTTKKYDMLYIDDCGWFYGCDLHTGDIRFYETQKVIQHICERALNIAEGDFS